MPPIHRNIQNVAEESKRIGVVVQEWCGLLSPPEHHTHGVYCAVKKRLSVPPAPTRMRTGRLHLGQLPM